MLHQEIIYGVNVAWVWLERRKVFSEQARIKCGNASIIKVGWGSHNNECQIEDQD